MTLSQEEHDRIREAIIQDVKKYRNKLHPGKPVGHFSIYIDFPIIHELVGEGVLKLISVTKQSKVDPSKTMTYTYVALNK